MKPLNRRQFLRASGALAGTAVLTPAAAGKTVTESCDDAVAKLYDATRCIGCRACEHRCRQVNELPAEPDELNGQAFDMPRDLSANDFMVLQAYRGDGGDGDWSFIKKNCMHCNEPACVSACPVAALYKTPEGPVRYEASKCMGCRYCMLACPYGVPWYEWVDRTPEVRKCTLCLECVDACPTGALTKGRRRDLIEEAHRRIEANPDRYVDHLYGEHEGGGTSYLILSGVPVEKLGFPKLSATVRSSYADTIMSTLPGWIIGLGLFLGGAHHLVERRARVAESSRAEAGERGS